MSRRVFHINAEVRPVARGALDRATVAGAAVRCLVAADSADDALTALCARLKAEWRNPGDISEVELAERARESGHVQFGTFYCWGHDAPDAT